LPIAAYYGVVVLWEAAPAIVMWTAGAITGAGLVIGGYVASKG
jgi:hypothetical protein